MFTVISPVVALTVPIVHVVLGACLSWSDCIVVNEMRHGKKAMLHVTSLCEASSFQSPLWSWGTLFWER